MAITARPPGRLNNARPMGRGKPLTLLGTIVLVVGLVFVVAAIAAYHGYPPVPPNFFTEKAQDIARPMIPSNAPSQSRFFSQ